MCFMPRKREETYEDGSFPKIRTHFLQYLLIIKKQTKMFQEVYIFFCIMQDIAY